MSYGPGCYEGTVIRARDVIFWEDHHVGHELLSQQKLPEGTSISFLPAFPVSQIYAEDITQHNPFR